MGRIVKYSENYKKLPKRFTDKIESDIKYILNSGLRDLTRIYYFGSCARGEVRNTSDIDLLICTREKISDRVLAADIRWMLDEPLQGVRTDVVYRSDESVPPDSAFNRAVDRDKKLILEVVD